MTSEEQKRLIDYYGELTRQIEEFRPVVVRHKNVKDEIEAWCADRPAENCEYDGRIYRVQVGPCAFKRTIPSMRRIYRALGVTRFLEWCTFPMSAVDKVFADSSGYVEESQTGPRTVKAVLLAPAEASKPAKKAA